MELRPSLNRYFSVSEGATSIQPTLTQCSLSKFLMVHSLFTYTVDFSTYSSPNMRYFVRLYMAYVMLRGPNGSPDVTSRHYIFNQNTFS